MNVGFKLPYYLVFKVVRKGCWSTVSCNDPHIYLLASGSGIENDQKAEMIESRTILSFFSKLFFDGHGSAPFCSSDSDRGSLNLLGEQCRFTKQGERPIHKQHYKDQLHNRPVAYSVKECSTS